MLLYVMLYNILCFVFVMLYKMLSYVMFCYFMLRYNKLSYVCYVNITCHVILCYITCYFYVI